MKNFLKIIIFLLCCLTGFFLLTRFEGTQYNTDDAVTYFDEKGQYQLINSVAEDYAIYDAKAKRFITGFVLYYIQKEDKIYMITNPSRREIVYAVLNIKEEVLKTDHNIGNFTEAEQKILMDTEQMVDLSKPRSQAMKNILNFLPQKWRKW